jgi:membrane protease YdiL (CAAX protease family)
MFPPFFSDVDSLGRVAAHERGLSLHRLGISGGSGFSIVLLAAGGAALIAVGHWMNLRRMAGANHPAAERLRAMATRLFPRSALETVFYILLAVTAGICEEFIFRGFVIAFFAGLSAHGDRPLVGLRVATLSGQERKCWDRNSRSAFRFGQNRVS